MSKPAGYRYGSWLVLHGSGVHLVGFSTACWLSHDNGGDTLGLWSRCRHSQCSRLPADKVPDWLVATRVLASLSVVLIVMWLAVGCQCRCLKTQIVRHKWMTRLEELLAITAGCFAFLSVGVVAVESAGDPVLKDYSVSWSLWLVVGGVSAVTIGGFIVAVTRRPVHPGAPKPSTRTIGPSSLPGPPPDSSTGVGGGQRVPRDGDVLRIGGGPGGVGDLINGSSRRRGDIADIFNITPFAAADLGRGGGGGGGGGGGDSGSNNNSNVIAITSTAAAAATRRGWLQRDQPHGGNFFITSSSTSPYCWTNAGMPPPYSFAVTTGHTSHGVGGVGVVGVGGGDRRGGREPDAPTATSTQQQQQHHQMLELSLSPPPPYESVVSEPPPPYQQYSPVSFVVQDHVPVPDPVESSVPPDSADCGGGVRHQPLEQNSDDI